MGNDELLSDILIRQFTQHQPNDPRETIIINLSKVIASDVKDDEL